MQIKKDCFFQSFYLLKIRMHKRMLPPGGFDYMVDITYVLTT